MNYKTHEDYYSLLLKHIENRKLVDEIQNNINFVEKYLDSIDPKFEIEFEKNLAYKLLGVLAFSSVEALWKGLALSIYKICEKHQCACSNCPYKKYKTISQLNNASISSILEHLEATRLIAISPPDYLTIKDLKNKRNFIHLLQLTNTDSESFIFNKDYVEDVLRLYYVTLNQADLCEWYLGEKTACLKELDENGYEYSLAQNKREKGDYLAQKIIYACVGWSKDPKKDLQLLQDKLVNFQMVIDFLGQWIYFKGATFQKEEKYSQYLKELYNLINSYAPYEPNLTAKIEERRQSFSLPSSNN